MARNYDNTGVQSGGGTFIKIHMKDAAFELPDGTKSPSFSCYLDQVNMEFRDAMPEHKIPARWAVNLHVSARLAGDPEEGAKYIIPLSSHYKNPVMSGILNALRGGMELPAWESMDNRYFRIFLRMKKPQGSSDEYCSALVYATSERGSEFLPNFYPWNEAGRFYEGVPTDMEKTDEFWLGVAHAMVCLTGGTIIGKNRASIPLPDPIGITLDVTPTPPPANPAPSTAPPTVLDRAKTFVENKLAAGTKFADLLTVSFETLKKNGATNRDMEAFGAWMTMKGTSIGAIAFGYIDLSGNFVSTEASQSKATTPPPTDDLPF